MYDDSPRAHRLRERATIFRKRMELARLVRESNPDRWIVSPMPDFGYGRAVLFFNPARNRTVTLRIAF